MIRYATVLAYPSRDVQQRGAASPRGSYLKFFVRRRRLGWHVWGDELGSDVDFGNYYGVLGGR